MNDPMALLALATVLVAAIALVAQLRARDMEQLRSNMTEQLHDRDVQLAEVRGEVAALTRVLRTFTDSFAHAFIDRKEHP